MKKLDYWKKKIKGISFDDLPEFLEEHGFRKFSSGGSGSFQFKHTKRKVVIKHGYLCTRKPRKDVIPSIILPIKNPNYMYASSCFKIIIQPLLCETGWSIKEYKKKYREDLEELAVRHPLCDVGRSNVGIYKDKLVMIDW